MPVTIQKKPATLIAVDTDTAVEQIIDPSVIEEYLSLTSKLEKHDAKVAADRKRHEDLKKQIVGVVDEVVPAEEKVLLKGTGQRELEVSARASSTSITDLEKAKKFLGTETFWQIAKVGITDLRAYLTKPQFEQVTKTELVGARKTKIIG